MLTIIYTSRVRHAMPADEVIELGEAASQKNQRLGITGLLLASSTGFLQYLEGPSKPVIQVMDAIARDSRHFDVIIWERQRINARLFPEWSMNTVCVENGEVKIEGESKLEQYRSETLSHHAMRWIENGPRSVDMHILINEIANTYRNHNHVQPGL